MPQLNMRVTVVLALLAAASVVAGAPATPARRVVLADPDPELRRAVEAALRPWHLEVVVEPDVPASLAAAQARADARTARFVVWREAGELVVYDRDSGLAERRPARTGSFDAVGAAAAALTVKTMMRLPPPTPEVEGAGEPVAGAPAPEDRLELRLSSAVVGRYERGLDSNTALRFWLGAAVRPWRTAGWRFGALVDLGGSAQVAQAGFHGTWTNWSALAIASWTLPRGAWELEPWAAVGVERSSLDGIEAGTHRIEPATLATVRGGAAWRYPLGRWRLGAVAGMEVLPSTRTYTKLGSPAPVFKIPAFGLVAGVMLSTDMSP